MSEGKKRISKPLKVIGIILSVVLVIVIVVSIFAVKNVKAMNNCIDSALDVIRENHQLTEIAEEEYGTVKINPLMKFDVDHYRIDDVGNLSIMKMNMGIMQMATFVITPDEKDIPVLSADYIYVLPIRKTYLEVYDLVIDNDDTYKSYINQFQDIKDSYADIPDMEYSETWYSDLITVGTYKQGKTGDDDDFAEMLAENVRLMLSMADEYPALAEEDIERKQQIVVDYSDGLIEKGGVSTDVFKKSLGEETTKDFFDKVFFGTASE